MSGQFIVAAFVAPLMVLAAAGIVYAFSAWQDDRDMRLARERGELPPV